MNPKPERSLFSLHLSRWVFTPKLLPTLVVLLCLPILIGLGYWQLTRAHTKRQIEQQLLQQTHANPKSLHQLGAQPQQFTPVMMTGEFDNKHVMLLDNQMHAHQAGYQVLAPFLARGDSRWILVNRGWVPRLQDRQHFPSIAPVLGVRTITGILRVPGKAFLLSQQLFDSHWPLLIQAIQLDKISQILRRPLYPFVVLLSPNAREGFVRDWNVTPVVSAHKHYAYAVQWFGLALALMVIYIILSTRRP